MSNIRWIQHGKDHDDSFQMKLSTDLEIKNFPDDVRLIKGDTVNDLKIKIEYHVSLDKKWYAIKLNDKILDDDVILQSNWLVHFDLNVSSDLSTGFPVDFVSCGFADKNGMKKFTLLLQLP